jgi:LmbE family N-acetylglucosaminyl deacetylase
MFVLADRLLVVAAHPDDDAIGCGGTMSLVARSGGSVHAMYLTDGSRSHPGSRAFAPGLVRDLREHEALASLAELGAGGSPDFLRLPDSGLGELAPYARAKAVRRIADAIERLRPDLILAPWRRDPHPDHIAASELTADAVRMALYSGDVAGYEVWLPIRGTPSDDPQPHECRGVRIALDAAAMEAKRRAILAHRTQTTSLIADDPGGFRIDAALLARWVTPVERLFYMQMRNRELGAVPAGAGRS